VKEILRACYRQRGCAAFTAAACGSRQSSIQAVKMVASIAAVHGCGTVFMHMSGRKRVGGIVPFACV
jgi:hypothetical protein